MATPTTISKLSNHVGEEIELKGWLYNRRSSGKLHFLQIRDGTGFCQCTAFKGAVSEEAFEAAGTLPYESSLIIRGECKADDRAPGGFEVGITELDIINPSTQEYPIALQEHGVDFLLTHRHLWLRHPSQWAVMRIRHVVIAAVREFFDSREFTLIDSPIFTPAACEGTSTLFEVGYFDEQAYLTQSGQLYIEAAAMALRNVYCFGPTFRAEKSKTRRHLTEFWMVEPEMAFAELNDIMDLAETFICHLVDRVLEKCQHELEVLERDVSKLEAIKPPFPRISYDEAVQILKDAGQDFEWGGDFGAPDETILSEKYDKPVMIHRYPKDVKAFYMKQDPENDKVALCLDVLAPEGIGEIIGGAQREDDLDLLEKSIEEHKLPKEAFEWYLDVRRFGSVPHGGFGLGIERTVGWLAGREHVRECIPFPRTIYRIHP